MLEITKVKLIAWPQSQGCLECPYGYYLADDENFGRYVCDWTPEQDVMGISPYCALGNQAKGNLLKPEGRPNECQ